MRRLALLPLLLLGGCLGQGNTNITETGIESAQPQTVRIAGVPQPVQLTGEMDIGRRRVMGGTVPRHEIAIAINGQEAIRQVVQTYQSTQIAGSWNGMPVTSDCRYDVAHDQDWRASRRFTCTVSVNQQVAGTLVFTAYGRGRRPNGAPPLRPSNHANAKEMD